MGGTSRDCQNRSLLLRRVVQAEHRHLGDGGRESVGGGAGEEGSPGREVRAQGGLTEQEQEERAQQEPNLHGLCSSPGASDANTGKPASSQIFPVAWYPLWLPLNQA